MKKIISLFLLILVIASTAILFSGCKNKKVVDDDTLTESEIEEVEKFWDNAILEEE